MTLTQQIIKKAVQCQTLCVNCKQPCELYKRWRRFYGTAELADLCVVESKTKLYKMREQLAVIEKDFNLFKVIVKETVKE